MTSSKGIMKAKIEAEKIIREKDKYEREGVFGAPKTFDNPLEWIFVIRGQKDSPYSGGYWVVNLTLPKDYPFKAPKVVFMTSILHPNISKTGEVCHDWLKGSWQPTIKIIELMREIRRLLTLPNYNDPLNIDAANMHKKDPETFAKTVREHTNTNARKSNIPRYSVDEEVWS